MAQQAWHPALRRLDALVGEWELTTEVDGNHVASARTRGEWLEGGAYLVLRSEGEPPADASEQWRANWPLPSTVVVGLDNATGRFAGLYADARGVHRIYQMTLEDGVWTQWRDAPGFHQRFTGTFSAGGQTVTARWELSKDGTAWRTDFDLTYRKVV